MSKDRPQAVLAVLCALFFVPGAGSAGAMDTRFATGIGAGIDHTMRARIEQAQSQVSAADAVDLLSRLSAQPLLTRQPSQGFTPTSISGLRGLLVLGGLDAAPSTPPPAPTGPRWAPTRRASSATPYVRFSEVERVLGISFKIQPPQQTPEPASPGL